MTRRPKNCDSTTGRYTTNYRNIKPRLGGDTIPAERGNMAYRDFIENMKREWVGKTVKFDGVEYTVKDVDYNGALMIDKPARYTELTAVGTWQIDR